MISEGGRPPSGILWSADVATGLMNGTSGPGVVSDIDDGAAIVAALNSGLNIDLIVPVTGNAHVSAELSVTRMIVHDLKKHVDVAVKPGAPFPIVPIQDSPAGFINGTLVPEKDLLGSCVNAGVWAMKKRLAAGASAGTKRTVLATGPLTDVACLVENFPDEAQHIDRVVALGGRHGMEPLVFEGKEGLTDFNIRMDPAAVQLLLDSDTPLVFVPFNLSSSTVYSTDQFGQGLSAELRETSDTFKFFQDAVDARAGWYEQVGFGRVVVPWDTWTLLYVLHPDALRCKPMVARLQPCAYAPWDPNFNATNGVPYNDKGDAQRCGGHGAGVAGGSLMQETSQLQFFPAADGTFASDGVHGMWDVPASPESQQKINVVTVCDEASSDSTYDIMKDLALNKVY